jgi:hypothetical protein
MALERSLGQSGRRTLVQKQTRLRDAVPRQTPELPEPLLRLLKNDS